jgi:hypothetical protein
MLNFEQERSDEELIVCCFGTVLMLTSKQEQEQNISR